MAESLPRRKSIRLAGYDYSSAGCYFITVCSFHRKCIFGEIIQGKFHSNPAGQIVSESWFELPYHYAGLELDAFVIMPNHVHGIVALCDPVGAGFKPAPGMRKRRSLSEVMRAFKTFSSRRINEGRAVRTDPVWQRGYYEHIIRGEKALRKIRAYISNNPLSWDADVENQFRKALSHTDPAAILEIAHFLEPRSTRRASHSGGH
jgi:putative transposase